MYVLLVIHSTDTNKIKETSWLQNPSTLNVHVDKKKKLVSKLR